MIKRFLNDKTMDKKQRETLQYVAQLMFIEGGQAQKEIAARLGVSEQTICRWAKAGQWDALRANLLTSRRRRLAELYAELEEFNRMVAEKEGYKVASSKEADARRKLIADIKELEDKYSVAQISTVAMDFCDFVRTVDDTLAGRVMELFNEFISKQMEERKWQG